MRTIRSADFKADSGRLRALLQELGRKRSLRDPIALMTEELRFTPAQIHSLLWLGSEGAMTMGEIATRLGITEKTITGVVDRLEADDYVQRERHAEDRRVVHVRLTRKGTTAFNRFEGALVGKIDSFMALLESEERRTLIRILEKLLERLTAATPRRLPST